MGRQGRSMDPKVVALIGVGLRIFIFICLLIAMVVIATDKYTLISGFRQTFNDVQGYRYVLSVAIIGFVHTILQLGFSIYHVLTQNIPFWNGLPQFNYYADQVMTWVLATAAGAGFALSAELKGVEDSGSRDYDYAFFSPELNEQKSLIDDFFDKANVATAILFLAFLSMATLVLLSPFNRINPTATRLPTQDHEAQKVETQSSQAEPSEAQSLEPPSG